MCKFKSGIILKERCYIENQDSHSEMLETLGIKDDYLNATKTFVRAELVPKNDEWWTSPENWKFIVDQDVVPEWFELERDKYEVEFRNAVIEWHKEHVLMDQKFEELSSGYYRLKRCEVKKLTNDVKVVLDNSTINEMWGNSTVNKMWNNSTVNEMWDNSTINEMWGNSTVNKMLDNSTVNEMWDNSTVNEMRGNSTVNKMLGNSTINEMRGNSTVNKMRNNSTVNKMWNNSTVNEMWDNSTVNEMRGNSTVNKMWNNSTVNKMRGNSIAINYYENKIFVSSNTKLQVVKLENKEEK